MAYQPTHLEPYERPAHYGGAEFHGYYTVYGVHRESDTLTRSNWRSIIRALGFAAESDVPNFDPRESDDLGGPNVIITRAGHPLVGWVDTLRIRTDAPDHLLRTADEILAGLEDYPIVDEDDFSTLEYDEAATYWERCSVAERVDILQRHAGSTGETPSSIFAARRPELPGDIDIAHLVN